MSKWTEMNFDNALDQAVAIGLEYVGILISGTAITLVPVDTGRLKGSITYATTKSKSKTKSPATSSDAVDKPSSKMELWVGTNVEYAEYVEYGYERKTGKRKRVPAQSFLRAALDYSRTQAQQLFDKALSDTLRKASQ